MRNLDKMWIELGNDRASTPIQKRSSISGPRTSTPKINLFKNSNHRKIKKKKKKKKQTKNSQQNKHFIQIWFL